MRATARSEGKTPIKQKMRKAVSFYFCQIRTMCSNAQNVINTYACWYNTTPFSIFHTCSKQVTAHMFITWITYVGHIITIQHTGRLRWSISCLFCRRTFFKNKSKAYKSGNKLQKQWKVWPFHFQNAVKFQTELNYIEISGYMAFSNNFCKMCKETILPIKVMYGTLKKR